MAEGFEDEGYLDGKERSALAGQQLAQTGIVIHVETQLCPGCAGADGREIELGKLRTAVGLLGHLKFEF